MDEKDVKGFIKREEFESLAAGLLERIRAPCSKALTDTHLSAEKIHSVELVGSGSRIPAIARVIASLFRIEPRCTLNASECVARGCAFQCAMLSPVFRDREYEVQDFTPFTIGFLSDEGPIGTGPNDVLFPKGQPIPCTKVLTLRRSSLFHLEASYADPSELPAGASPKISCFMIGPFQSSHSGKARIKVGEHGDDLMDTDSVSSEAVADGFQESEQSNSSHSSGDGRHNRATSRQEIPINENIYGGMTKAELSEAQTKELQLARQDRAMEQTKDKKNALSIICEISLTHIEVSQVTKRGRLSPGAYSRHRTGFMMKEMMKLRMPTLQSWKILRSWYILLNADIKMRKQEHKLQTIY